MKLHRLMPFLIAVALLRVAAIAAPGGIEDIEPRVERTVLARSLVNVPMDDDQRLISDMLYADYAVGLQRLAEKAARRVEDAGRQRVEDALSGRVFLDPDELRRMRVAVAEAELETWAEADGLARALLEDTRLTLAEEAGHVFDLAVRDVHRSMYLGPRRHRDQDDAYAGDGLDVIALVAEASANGGELAPVDPAQFAAPLEAYADRIDQYLRETAAASRRSRTTLAVARIERNEPARQAEEQIAVRRWRELYEPTQVAIEAVAAVAREAAGPKAEMDWRDRVDAATFPRLCRPTSCDKAYDWIVSRVDDTAVRGEADTLYEGFATRDRALRREAIDVMLRGRLERGVIVHPRMDPSSTGDPAVRALYQQLLKNSGRRAALASETTGLLEALLTDGQRKQMRADIAAAAYGRRRR